MLFCCVDRHLGLLVVRSLFVNNKEGGLCFAVIKILRTVRVFVYPLFSFSSVSIRERAPYGFFSRRSYVGFR